MRVYVLVDDLPTEFGERTVVEVCETLKLARKRLTKYKGIAHDSYQYQYLKIESHPLLQETNNSSEV